MFSATKQKFNRLTAFGRDFRRLDNSCAGGAVVNAKKRGEACKENGHFTLSKSMEIMLFLNYKEKDHFMSPFYE
jgi:hypothetical protein